VLAGFYYNADIFKELASSADYQRRIHRRAHGDQKDGRYTPLAYGSAESWQLAYNGLYSIGPAYWKGEEGRLGLIDGKKKLTDPGIRRCHRRLRSLEAVPAVRPGKPELCRHDAAVHARQSRHPSRRFVGHQSGDLYRSQCRCVRPAGAEGG